MTRRQAILNRALILNALTRSSDAERNRRMANATMRDLIGHNFDAEAWTHEEIANYLANHAWSWSDVLKANS